MPKLKNDSEHTEMVWSRVDSVVNLILENDRYLQSKRNGELTQLVVKQFNVSERNAQRYIGEAKKEIRRVGIKEKEKAFVRAIRDREFLYSKAKTGLDFKLALEIVKDRDKLCGLYVDEVTVKGEIKTIPDLSGLTIEELKALASLKR